MGSSISPIGLTASLTMLSKGLSPPSLINSIPPALRASSKSEPPASFSTVLTNPASKSSGSPVSGSSIEGILLITLSIT